MSGYQASLFARNEGIERAGEHAGESWRAQALAVLIAYAREHDRFLIEEVRGSEAALALDAPPDNRAWGAVTTQAVRERIIVQDGHGQAKSSHLSPKPAWRSLVRA